MPDHIGVELEFMQEIAGQEAGAWEENDIKRAFHCRKIEKEFIGKHLVPWVPSFCKRVIKDAELSFYGEIAKLTKCFIEFEKKEINRWISMH
jgi:TorA maturation chaperone TorD